MNHQICVLPGDGIGPEVMAEGIKVLDAVGARYGETFEYETHLIGGCAIDKTGAALPPDTLDAAKAADAVLLGAVGGPKWDTTDPKGVRPEQGLLAIRRELDLFANIRPAHMFPSLIEASPLKDELVRDVDLVIVREATSGLYFGARGREEGVTGAGADGADGACAFDALDYAEGEIERIARSAFVLARSRGKKLHSVDKANILETSRLWREVVHRVGQDFPDVEVHDMLVDNAAMQLVYCPDQFDVIVTENMFGDILSDEAAALTGSLGMMASASLGPVSSLYEPTHGSAPDIAGQGIANPLAMIMSTGLLMNYSFGLPQAEADVLRAVNRVLIAGYRTVDLAGDETPASMIVGTGKMGDLVVEALS